MNIYNVFIWAVVVILLIISAFFVPTIRGVLGEREIKRKLSRLPSEDYRIINDVMIPCAYGLTQIDHVVGSKYGVFVIETKNMRGKIYGGERAKEWTKYSKGHKLAFKNPLHQNYGHVKAIVSLLNISGNSIIGIVVFTTSARIMFSVSGVVYENQLINEISKYKNHIFDENDVARLCDKIQSSNQVSYKAKKDHVDRINAKRDSDELQVKYMNCPKCGGNLIVRNGKYGQFYGCSNYPKCRFTKNLK